MAQPLHIELQTGPDRFYHFASGLLWLFAATLILFYAWNLAWPLLLVAVLLLFFVRPGKKDTLLQSKQLLLYRNGAAKLDARTGRWGLQTSICRWFSIVRIDFPQETRRVLVCASRNSSNDYRSLLVWTRFPPFNPTSERFSLE